MAALRFDVISVFPDALDPERQPLLAQGVVARALKRGLIEIEVHDLRDHTHDRHRQVDDAPFGGGAGMVLKPEPVFEAVEALRGHNRGPVVLLEPWGEPLGPALAQELAAGPGLIVVCGRYEGIDERVHEHLADRVVSIGDYVLSGGELPALILVEAVARLVPGVLGAEESLAQDSFASVGEGGQVLMGYPQYTRPADFRGMQVPAVLLSGDHAGISKWRRRRAEERTRERTSTGDRAR